MAALARLGSGVVIIALSVTGGRDQARLRLAPLRSAYRRRDDDRSFGRLVVAVCRHRSWVNDSTSGIWAALSNVRFGCPGGCLAAAIANLAGETFACTYDFERGSVAGRADLDPADVERTGRGDWLEALRLRIGQMTAHEGQQTIEVASVGQLEADASRYVSDRLGRAEHGASRAQSGIDARAFLGLEAFERAGGGLVLEGVGAPAFGLPAEPAGRVEAHLRVKVGVGVRARALDLFDRLALSIGCRLPFVGGFLTVRLGAHVVGSYAPRCAGDQLRSDNPEVTSCEHDGHRFNNRAGVGQVTSKSRFRTVESSCEAAQG